MPELSADTAWSQEQLRDLRDGVLLLRKRLDRKEGLPYWRFAELTALADRLDALIDGSGSARG